MSEHASPGEPDLRDRPAAELIKQLSEQSSVLVRQELELARAELTQKGKQLGIGAGMFAGSGLFGFYAFGALTACLVLVLALVVDGWLAALIVAVVYAAVAGGLALWGKGRVAAAAPAVPERTADSVREDVQQTKQRAKAGRG